MPGSLRRCRCTKPQRRCAKPLFRPNSHAGRRRSHRWCVLRVAIVGWEASAKGHVATLLPVPRSEYLALDVVAFESAGASRWRFPVAVFELENSADDDFVAYSLWKVLCVRAKLRVVFCYRRDAEGGNALVRHLSEQVARAMELQDRAALTGDTLLVVGSRSEANTFPYGFFKNWLFDTNVGKFARS